MNINEHTVILQKINIQFYFEGIWTLKIFLPFPIPKICCSTLRFGLGKIIMTTRVLTLFMTKSPLKVFEKECLNFFLNLLNEHLDLRFQKLTWSNQLFFKVKKMYFLKSMLICIIISSLIITLVLGNKKHHCTEIVKNQDKIVLR